MKANAKVNQAFTLIELLTVLAVIGILAALLLTTLGKVMNQVKRTICLNNLRQINLGTRMYSDDSSDALPNTRNMADITNSPWTGYKELIKDWIGLKGSTKDKIFACPADKFCYDWKRGYVPRGLHQQARSDFTSYWFNGVNLRTNIPDPFTGTGSWPGIGGCKLSSIQDPTKTVLIAESPAFFPYSWHDPKPVPPRSSTPFWNPGYNNARDMVSFVDGHASYIKMYWTDRIIMSCFHDPPAGYDYKWSND